MSFASAWSREDVGIDVRKCPLAGDALSLSPRHCLMPIAPRLGSRWREHEENLPPVCVGVNLNRHFSAAAPYVYIVVQIAGT